MYSDIAPVRTLTTLTAVPYYTWATAEKSDESLDARRITGESDEI